MFKKSIEITLATVLTVTAPGIASAGKADVGTLDPGFVVDNFHKPEVTETTETPVNQGKVLNAGTTSFVSQGIQDGFSFCASIAQKEYTPDCLRERIETLAASLPEDGEYSQAKQLLEEASQKLSQVVAANRAPSRPRGRATGTVRNTPVRTAPLAPVRSEQLRSSVQAAVAILDETSTKLLRAAGTSERRKVHYQEMAVAMGSNKILLRSA